MTLRFTLLVGAALLALPTLTDWAVDHQFRRPPDQGTAYTTADLDAFDRLLARVTSEAEVRRRHKRLSGSDEQAALRELWGPGE